MAFTNFLLLLILNTLITYLFIPWEAGMKKLSFLNILIRWFINLFILSTIVLFFKYFNLIEMFA